MNQSQPWRTPLVLAVASLVGVIAFLTPFWLSGAQRTGASRTAHGGDAPYLFAIIGVVCLAALLVETGGGADPDAKRVALLGVLVSTNAALRLLPGVLGASPVFFLPICVGFVWGPSFGFLLGAASIAVSALLTGGIGPWLPFQMMTLGWVGMTAGLLPHLPTWKEHREADSPPLSVTTRRLILLAVFGAVWGFGYGAIMNLWFWPFAAPASPRESGLYWSPGLGLTETLRRYAIFYGATSAVYDGFRAAGNVAMVALFGRPVLLLLLRFRDRFTWQPIVYTEEPSPGMTPRP